MGFLSYGFLYKFCFSFLVLKQSIRVTGDLNFPCYFIFGDSWVDVGNNNGLITGAKANYLPYGLDFPQGPTGRFSNGLIVVDFIAKYLGFKYFIPPYTKVKRKDVLKGVNYASAGAGILDESGDNLGDHISFNRQILHHKKVISHIETLQGNQTYTTDYLKKCLYTIHIGSNDYINNYFAPKTLHKRHNFSHTQFATILVDRLSMNFNAVSAFGQIGCSPAEKKLFGSRDTCVKEIDDALRIFMAKRRILLADLNSNLTDAKFVVPDLDIPTNSLPQFEGKIFETNTPCCKVSTKLRTRGQCLNRSETCYDRTRYWFFDGFHPTEFANLFYSSKMMVAINQLL